MITKMLIYHHRLELEEEAGVPEVVEDPEEAVVAEKLMKKTPVLQESW